MGAVVEIQLVWYSFSRWEGNCHMTDNNTFRWVDLTVQIICYFSHMCNTLDKKPEASGSVTKLTYTETKEYNIRSHQKV